MSDGGREEQLELARPMNVRVVRTKAEAALFEELAGNVPDLPGASGVKKARQQALARFSATGLPHRRIEEWKYTDLRNLLKQAYPIALPEAPKSPEAAPAWMPGSGRLLELEDAIEVRFIDDTYVGTRQKLPKGVTVETLGKLLEEEPAWLLEDIGAVAREPDATLALNTAMMAEGAVVRVKARTHLEAPVHLVFEPGRSSAAALGLRNLIYVGEGASVTLIETYVAPEGAPRQRSGLTRVVAGAGAEITHVQVFAYADGSAHIGATLVRLAAGACYRPFLMTVGAGLVRNDMRLAFDGEGASLDLGAVMLADAHGHSDTTLVIDHAVPSCTSRELVKAVLDGSARAVFQGKVIVRPGAQKTDGKQSAQALLLSPEAEFDSKPELEIYADDVVCGHGSTSADLDENLVFYCRSRGIPLAEARALLVESFIGEAVGKVANEPVREGLLALGRRWLSRDAA